jgi:hypothetical protein
MRKKSTPAERRISRVLYCDVAIEKLLLAFERNQGLRPILAEVLETVFWHWTQGLSPKISDAMRLHEVAGREMAEPPAEPQAGRAAETASQLAPVPAGAIHASP